MGHHAVRISLLFFICLVLPFSLARAQVEGKAVLRKILAFYSLQEKGSDIFFTPIHHRVEMPLNHLGLEVEFRSLSEPLPTADEMKEYRGVVTWFTKKDEVTRGPQFCTWLDDQLHNGRKLVIMGQWGFEDKQGEVPSECLMMLRTLGVAYRQNKNFNPLFYEIVHKDDSMVEFERKLHWAEGLIYDQVRLIDPAGVSFLTLQLKEASASSSDLVVLTPKGGFIYPGYESFADLDLNKFHWRINPFKFFSRAFAAEGLPRPDVSTINGQRIFYSHIDGDGIFNLSNLDRESFSGEVILNEVLKKYPTVPITASIITGYIDQRRFNNERAQKLYRDIFSLPNVEPAAHGYAHPLNWGTAELALKISGYRFSPEKETLGSVEMVGELLQKNQINKTSNLFLWTGNCLPDLATLALINSKGLLNMNGGDSRFDHQFDSYGFIAPLGLKRGKYQQFYSSNSNENTYTNTWNGPYYGFSLLPETFQNTEAPLRLRPMNIYYHYYSGERQASLKALHEAYDYALAQKIHALSVSDYVRILDDFFTLTLFTIPDGYRIKNRGYLRTLRFDNEPRFVDLKQSRGVIGMQHYQGNLYVFLDEGGVHDVRLSTEKSVLPYIHSASFNVDDFSYNAQSVRFKKKGWYKSELVLGGMKPQQNYQVNVEQESLQVRADEQGYLAVVFPSAENAGKPREVLIKPWMGKIIQR